jgi:hypothetical protein
MRQGPARVVFYLLVVAACRSAQPHADSPAAYPNAPPPSAEAAGARAIITAAGLGPFRIGQPFPFDRFSEEGLEAAYETSFYADAQPLEGFRMTEPPVFVTIANGAFTEWGRANPGEPPPPSIRTVTLERVRAGKAEIEMVISDRAGVSTASGLEVGAPLSAFQNAHPKERVEPLPALWEEPTCAAQAEGLWVFFDVCAGAMPSSSGEPKIKRIVARR